MESPDIWLKLIPIGFTIGGFVAGMVAGFSVAYYRLHQLEIKLATETAARTADYQQLRSEISRRFTTDGSELRYRTVAGCAEEQRTCREGMVAALTALTNSLDRMDKRWEKVIVELYQSGGGRRGKNISTQR